MGHSIGPGRLQSKTESSHYIGSKLRLIYLQSLWSETKNSWLSLLMMSNMQASGSQYLCSPPQRLAPECDTKLGSALRRCPVTTGTPMCPPDLLLSSVIVSLALKPSHLGRVVGAHKVHETDKKLATFKVLH